MSKYRSRLARCAFCGKEFIWSCNSSQYCSRECMEKADNVSLLFRKEIKELLEQYRPKSQPKVPLEDAVRMAKEAGLSYGQFMARTEDMK